MVAYAGQRPRDLPWLIQGGMGVAVSHWPLARAVARAGQLGVVSGTAIDSVFIRRLQDHGVDDTLRRVLQHFPLQSVVSDVLAKYASAPRGAKSPYKTTLVPTHRRVEASQDLLVLAAYAEVAQAKEGHEGTVGINLLTKVQIPTAPTLFGAMLAGVDYVLMGAGIPSHIPGVLDRLTRGEAVETSLEIEGAGASAAPTLRFDPRRLMPRGQLRRPKFLAIVSSHVLATALLRRSSGTVEGFVVEGPVAGGHNAPPRGPLTLDVEGSPVYGDRDRPDYAVLRELGVPFWIAGGVTSPARVHEALELGATGVQVGTLFAYCRESGMDPTLRDAVIATVRAGTAKVVTSARASSTGYPFKVVRVKGTLSEPADYEGRTRVCDLGLLRQAYVTPDGGVGYRCSAEPTKDYERKSGAIEDTVGRVCLCNALMAAAGLGQVRKGIVEPPIVTSGDSVNEIAPLLVGRDGYDAHDVIEYLKPDQRTTS